MSTLTLEEISHNETTGERIYRVIKKDRPVRGLGRMSSFIGTEIACRSGEDLIEKIFGQLEKKYKSKKNRFKKKLRKKAATLQPSPEESP